MKFPPTLLAGMSVLISANCSPNPRPKANAYLAPEGRVNYIRKGFEKISMGMTESEVKEAVGHPFNISVWRGITTKLSLVPGERLGTRHTYWMKVSSYSAARNYDADRWLDFFFDLEGKLVKIEGNFDGNHFTKKDPQDSALEIPLPWQIEG